MRGLVELPVLAGVSGGVAVGMALVADGGEIGGEIGVHGDDLGYVAVDLLDERDVLHEIVVNF